MSRQVVFYGASDDLIEVEDESGKLTEEYSPREDSRWVGVLEDPENGDTAYVYVSYESNGCWVATLGIYDEGYSLPDWNPRIVLQHAYATGIALTLPESVTLTEVTA